jgi:hypothetical protein
MKTVLMLAVLLTLHVLPEHALNVLLGHALHVLLVHVAARLAVQEQQLQPLEHITVTTIPMKNLSPEPA